MNKTLFDYYFWEVSIAESGMVCLEKFLGDSINVLVFLIYIYRGMFLRRKITQFNKQWMASFTFGENIFHEIPWESFQGVEYLGVKTRHSEASRNADFMKSSYIVELLFLPIHRLLWSIQRVKLTPHPTINQYLVETGPRKTTDVSPGRDKNPG